MTSTQQHEYKIIMRAFEQRHGVGSWLMASADERKEYTDIWMDGYNELARWKPVADLSPQRVLRDEEILTLAEKHRITSWNLMKDGSILDFYRDLLQKARETP